MNIVPGDELSPEEYDALYHRISVLMEDHGDDEYEDFGAIAYVQGMVECILSTVRPDLFHGPQAARLLGLAKRAAHTIIKEKIGDYDDPRRN